MPPDERRAAIIDATIPLLLEHGASVTTRQVAEAAGIAEGTIFRVFASKDDLLSDAAHTALSDDGLEKGLAAIGPDLGLDATIAAVVDVLSAQITRMRLLVATLHALPGAPSPHAATADEACTRPDPNEHHARIADAVAAALAPHADALATTPERAAAALMALTFGARHPFAGTAALTDRVITDILLHGITKDARCS